MDVQGGERTSRDCGVRSLASQAPAVSTVNVTRPSKFHSEPITLSSSRYMWLR